jgi:hypothetical protein
MKSLLQTLGAIVAVVALVAGITFVSQIMTREDTTPTPGPNPADAEPGLRFPTTSIDTGAEYPLHTDGHYNFWFRNPHDKPIDLGILPGREGKNCDCSSVEAALLTPEFFKSPEDWKQFQSQAPATAVALIGAPTPLGYVANHVEVWPMVSQQLAGMHRFLADKLRWHTLTLEDPLTVPGQTDGVVRLTWHGNRTEPSEMNTLRAGLWTREPDAQRPTLGPRLSVLIAFVAPIRIEPPTRTITVRELAQGEKGEAEFICWSSTHSQFTIEPVPQSEFVTVQKPRALGPSELKELAARFKERTAQQEWRKKNTQETPRALTPTEIDEYAKGKETQVLAAYAVPVTVCETLNDKQLPLGPFSSEIHFKGELHGVEIPPVLVTSLIRGEVTVTAPGDRDPAQEQRDRLTLGEFYSDRGKELSAKITADRPGIEVKLVGLEPEALKKYLEVDPPQPVSGASGDDTRVWTLRIRVPPDRLQGRLPPRSVIILETKKGTSARLIRVPITGHGSVRGR